MKNVLIGVILNSLLQEYNEGACDDLPAEEQNSLLESLVELKDKLEDKQDKVLTIEEASVYLNVSRQTLNKYVKEGKISPKKHYGGVLEFRLKDLKQLIKSKYE